MFRYVDTVTDGIKLVHLCLSQLSPVLGYLGTGINSDILIAHL